MKPERAQNAIAPGADMLAWRPLPAALRAGEGTPTNIMCANMELIMRADAGHHLRYSFRRHRHSVPRSAYVRATLISETTYVPGAPVVRVLTSRQPRLYQHSRLPHVLKTTFRVRHSPPSSRNGVPIHSS